MSRLLLVVDHARDWAPYYPSEDVLTFDQYLQFSAPAHSRVRVINLCQSGRYLSQGYYCSLLAEARGHHVVPSVMTLNDLGRKGLFSLQLEELDPSVIQWLDQAAAEVRGDSRNGRSVKVRTYFGQAEQPELKPVARVLFERLPCPILEVEFRHRKGKGWQIETMKPASPSDLAEKQQDVFAAALDRFSSIVWRKPRTRRRYRFDLAMLVNPEDPLPPSDEEALTKFEKAGRKLGINVERITRRDYMRLPEYDGLFIRETTAIDHHTYRFARKAEAEGLVVIDDPVSILRCTNKVFLADLLRTNKVPTPKTLILSRDQKDAAAKVIEHLGFPVVVKIPDGAFSKGVLKAKDEKELAEALKTLFRQSALVLAQEYFPTDYDWRIGVLGGRAIYACKYFMVKGHWQIYQHGEAKQVESGDYDTLPTYEVPRNVVQAALNATRLIGDGLYGVDIKQAGNRVAVIEVNDNPSIDSDVEDRFLGGELYTLIMQEFLSRMEAKRR
ncbi:Glutathione synthase/RimK-type ligase, ATP-grasp superfamily [Marinobacter daqiaonensis]|uniref:Glutathione synthase/RimK-type ligase, ATP-grasp superfamily n=1 Tax=Marinobacter daqiaonensis TaxID=650891 RepID=A0A1I6GHT3_9GAMM|nr:RimK family protein [Marinobacter daqiaonensis]SFR41691.1 Glutathione synthase/RimK-type ligase, ATP-grasp superfamily [Marinobacter daqiaonensis]